MRREHSGDEVTAVFTTVVVVGGGRPGGNGMDSLAIEYDGSEA
jgi:hypothetical protein